MAISSVRTLVAMLDDGGEAGESAGWAANPNQQPPVNTRDRANERRATDRILCFIKPRRNTDTDPRRLNNGKPGHAACLHATTGSESRTGLLRKRPRAHGEEEPCDERTARSWEALAEIRRRRMGE